MLALQRQLTYRRTFASMKSIIITILIVFALIPMIAKAQFNTVSGHAPRVRFTAINEKEASPESDTSQVRIPQESELPNTIKQAERTSHVSMTYPLRTIKITSPFGYRTDPFTGKRAMHNGIDLAAHNAIVYSMLDAQSRRSAITLAPATSSPSAMVTSASATATSPESLPRKVSQSSPASQ